MKSIKSLRGRLKVGAAALGLAALPLAAGLLGTGAVSADSSSAPLIGSAGVVGVVQVQSFGSTTEVIVTLENTEPNTTYTVADCQLNADGSNTCVSDATADTITTDANGNAQAALTFSGAAATVEVKLTNSSNATDVDVAALAGDVGVPGPVVIP